MAANLAGIASPNEFQRNAPTPAFTLTFTPTIDFERLSLYSPDYWGFPANDATISSLTIGGQTQALTGCEQRTDYAIEISCLNGPLLAAGQTVVISISAGAYTPVSELAPDSGIFPVVLSKTVYSPQTGYEEVTDEISAHFTLVAAPTAQTYTLSYNSNGGSGTIPNQVQAPSDGAHLRNISMVTFNSPGPDWYLNGNNPWNTRADGTGTTYRPNAEYGFTADLTLYAQWIFIPASGGNNGGNTGGDTDSGDEAGTENPSTPSAPGAQAVANVSLEASVGELVAGTPVNFSATGLQDSAPYNLVVRSTPQTIAFGNAVGGTITSTGVIPTGLEAGWHTLTFTSTAADGSAVSSVTYFKVSPAGVLLEKTSSMPGELAYTGSDMPPFSGAIALVLFGAILLSVSLLSRPKAWQMSA